MKKSISKKDNFGWQKNAAFILLLIGVLGAVLFFNQVLANGDNSVLSVQRVDQFDNTKYSLTLDDPEGLSEFLINKADGSFIWGGEPKNGTPSCPTSITSDTVTLGPSDFPLSGYVIDCENANVQNSVQVSMPPMPISGHKFYDANSSGGAKDDDDPGIEGWGITLLDETGNEEDSTNTNGEYLYEFIELSDDTYIVCENAEQNWIQTYPTADDADDGAVSCDEGEGYAPWGWEVTIENGEIVGGPDSFDFGNTPKLGDISVVKFNDRNSNGVRDEGEPGIEDIEFLLNDDDLADNFLQQLYSYFLPEDFNRFTLTNGDGIAEWDRRLPAGTYEIEEQESEGWIRTTDGEQEVELNPGVKETEEVLFGNRRTALIVYKYDYDEGELIPGWEICLYEAIGGDGGYEKGDLVEPCQETNDDAESAFYGAAVFSSEGLDPDRYYIIDEEERAGWRLESVDGNYEDVLDYVLGHVLIRPEFDEEDLSVYLYNFEFAGNITAIKYFDENLGIVIPGWQICLREFDEENEEAGPVIECKGTGPDGIASWLNVLPGTYILDEEEREGWEHQGFSIGDFENADWADFDSEAGQARIDLDEGGRAEIHFLNFIDDGEEPISSFDEDLNYLVQDNKEPVVVSGISTDIGNEGGIPAGVKSAELKIYKSGGSGTVEQYPASSFFDVFLELECPTIIREPLPGGDTIPIEIVSLSLTSIDPITVSWSREFTPLEDGIYCFEASAVDLVNNEEHTAIGGPVAYVSVAQITEESIEEVSEASFTVAWTTDEPTTGRVIYDTESHEELGEAPNYGYAFSTETFDTDPKATPHSVTISGLTPGTTYYYRTVSAASPESVGDEGSTTTTESDEGGSDGGGGGGGGGGSGGGFIQGLVIGSPSSPAVPPLPPLGQVLGASIEDQIDAIQTQIIELQRRLIRALEDKIAKILRDRIAELQTRISALLGGDGE